MTSLPADSHVHSEFSWDTGGPDSSARGTMFATCERAVRIGLPGLFFTEHLDLEDDWFTDLEDFAEHERHLVGPDGVVAVPRFDVDGYLEEIDRCRAAFPELHIGTGLEFGQPGPRTEAAREQLDLTAFDRILGSLHTLELGAQRAEPNTMFRRLPADEVIRRYLAEIPAVVAADGPHEIVTHLDYAVRYWPEETEGPFDPRRFEEELRGAMRAIAASGRALEINTRRLRPWIPQWWAEEGGRSASAATPMPRSPSPRTSPRRRRWRSGRASAPAATPAISGGAEPPHRARRRPPTDRSRTGQTERTCPVSTPSTLRR